MADDRVGERAQELMPEVLQGIERAEDLVGRLTVLVNTGVSFSFDVHSIQMYWYILQS